jgi:hypothetical protein
VEGGNDAVTRELSLPRDPLTEKAGAAGLDIDAVRWAQSYELSQRAAG